MSNGNSSALDNASQDSNQNMSSAPAGSPSQSCGSPDSTSDQTISPDKTHWIAIELTDEEGHAIPYEDYSIALPDGTVIEGSLDRRGRARIAGIDAGSCKVSFPNRDADCWKKG